MKRFLVFALFLLLASIASAQIIIYPNPGGYGTGMHRFVPDSVLYIPSGCGVPSGTASLNSYGFGGQGQKVKMAAIFADTCGHHIYWYHPNDSSWSRIDTGGGGGGSDSAVLSGFLTKKIVVGTNIIIIGDTSAATGMRALIPFLADSTVKYVTPAQLAAAIGAIPNDTFRLVNVGAGTRLASASNDSFYLATLVNGRGWKGIKLGDSSVQGIIDTSAILNWLNGAIFGAAPIISPLTGLLAGNGSSPLTSVIVDAPLQYIGGHLKDTATSSGGSGMIPLANTHIYVGNASNVATDVAMSGDATIANTGAIAIGANKITTAMIQANAVDMASKMTGTMLAAQEPAHTGDVTNTAGSLALIIGTNKVTNSQAAQMAAHTYKGNNTGSTANPADITSAQLTADLNVATTSAQGVAPAANHNGMKLGMVGGVATWQDTTSVGSGSSNVNIGSGHRLAVPGTNNIKTVFASPPLLLDSTTNTNALTLKADTSAGRQHFATQAALADSSATLVHNNKYTVKGDWLLGTGAGTYQVLPLGPSGAVPTVDLSQPTGIRFAIPPTIYNVTDPSFGAKGDGQVGSDGYIVNGAPDVYSNLLTFVPTDTIGVGTGTQKYFLIKGGGTSGNDTLTKIASYISAHHVTVLINFSASTGGGHIVKFGHDDTHAFQAAYNAVYANGGGTVFVPSLSKGFVYPICGPIIHSDNLGKDPNSQIYVPSENFPFLTNPDSSAYTIKMLGDLVPTFSQRFALSNDSSQSITGGCTLQSWLVTNPGQGSVIGMAASNGTGYGNFTADHPVMENIRVQVPDGLSGAYRSGIDFVNAAGMQVKNCSVITDVPCVSEHTSVYPTFGMRFTGINGSENIYLDATNEASGFKFGFVISEHTSGQFLTGCCNTMALILATASNHSWHISTVKSHWNTNGIYADTLNTVAGSCRYQIDQFDEEAINVVGAKYNYRYTINDSLNKMLGTIGYFHGIAAISVTPLPTYKSTLTNLQINPLGNPLINPFILMGGAGLANLGTQAGINPFSNAVVELNTGQTATGVLNNYPQYVAATSQPFAYGRLGQFIGGYNTGINSDLADITFSTGSATNKGRMELRIVNVGTVTSDILLNGTQDSINVPIIFPASTTSGPSLTVPDGVAPTTPKEGDVYATTNHFWIYNNSTWHDILAGGSGGGGTPAGVAGDIQFQNVNGGFSTFPSSGWHIDSTNALINFTAANASANIGFTINNTGTAGSFFTMKNGAATALKMQLMGTVGTGGLFTANTGFINNSAGGFLIGTTSDIYLSTNGGTNSALDIKTNRNVILNGTTDNAAALQIPATTSSNGQIYLANSATDKTTPLNGELRYINHTLLFHDNSADINLLGFAVPSAPGLTGDIPIKNSGAGTAFTAMPGSGLNMDSTDGILNILADKASYTGIRIAQSTDGSAKGVQITMKNNGTDSMVLKTLSTSGNSGILGNNVGFLYNPAGLVLAANGNPVTLSHNTTTADLQVSSLGNLSVNSTTDQSMKFYVNGGIGMLKDSAITTSAGSVMPLGIDTATGRIVKQAVVALTSGSYTPTLTNTTNITTSIVTSASYMKVGNIIFVMVAGSVTPTGLGNTVLTFTLPITTGTATQNYVGSCTVYAGGAVASTSGLTSVNATTTATANFDILAVGTANYNILMQYTL